MKACLESIFKRASSSHPSRDRGKAVEAARNADPSGWISDEETRERFLRGKRIKNVVEVIKDHMIEAGLNQAQYLPYAVFTMKGWCFNDEEDLVQSSGSTPTFNEDHTNFIPETNFERFVVEQFKNISKRLMKLEKKDKKDSSTENTDEDSMNISDTK
ncbi:hypothetical protein LR48_Vigan03g088800 [Vigna angularis]|uniref:Uncharacterized protein n=1 Tax=Phaseolus angularis TaxID=3914 RepID=A0A0L9U414_PHAAN|nr:hypothetical protein LR48_Vigan03g088800 [Vigna angularis]